MGREEHYKISIQADKGKIRMFCNGEAMAPVQTILP
jgi:hypothetical protein